MLKKHHEYICGGIQEYLEKTCEIVNGIKYKTYPEGIDKNSNKNTHQQPVMFADKTWWRIFFYRYADIHAAILQVMPAAGQINIQNTSFCILKQPCPGHSILKQTAYIQIRSCCILFCSCNRAGYSFTVDK